MEPVRGLGSLKKPAPFPALPRSALAGLALGALLVPQTALATEGEGAPTLTWTAPANCPTATDVRSSIDRWVGETRSAAGSSARKHLVVHGVVRHVRGQFQVVLETDDGAVQGTRSVEAPSCKLATDAAVTVVTMLLRETTGGERGPRAGTARSDEDAPGVEGSVDRERPPALSKGGSATADASATTDTRDDYDRRWPVDVDTAPDRTSTPSRARASSGSLRVGLGSFVDSATLPSATPGLIGAVGWHWKRYALRAGVGASLSAHGTGRMTVDGRVLGADVAMWFGTIRGDVRLNERHPLGLTAGLDAGVLRATGTGAWVSSTSHPGWLAASAGPMAQWVVSDRLAVRASIEAVVPFVRPTLAIDLDVVHRPAPVSARANVGAEFGF